MKLNKFIQKLVKEKTITLVEESFEVSESYNKKSENSLKAAKILLKQKLLEESTAMIYYSMYHKANSLFRLIGIKCENHYAVIFLLKELFNIENKDILFVKTERINKQYYTDFLINMQDVKDLIAIAEMFIADVDIFMDNLTEFKKTIYKSNFKKSYF